MRQRTTFAGLMAAAVLASAALTAIPATAQSSHHRQQTKNTWRNAAAGAGALGVLGLVTHNNTLAIAGAAGGLYSLNRYEHDRKSQSHIDHQRAAMYRRSSYMHNGHRYERRTVTRHGQQYYQYVRR